MPSDMSSLVKAAADEYLRAKSAFDRGETDYGPVIAALDNLYALMPGAALTPGVAKYISDQLTLSEEAPDGK